MMSRTHSLPVLSLLSLSLAPITAYAQTGHPVELVSPADGFSSNGDLQLTVRVAKGFYEQVLVPTAAEATLTVTVDGCATTYTHLISDSGIVTPIRLNPRNNAVSGYHWLVDVDLTACQCHEQTTRIHHCDGCGRSFDTCSSGDETGSCAPRAVTVTLTATNRAGNSVCGGGACSMLSGVLEPDAGSSIERWVPARFWSDTDDDGRPDLCITRASSESHGQSCMPLPNQGGPSCE